MLVFIDESGDAGFKLEKGSSEIFIVACVIFDDELEAEKTSIKIKELFRELKKSDRFEFKFNKCSKKLRLKFLKAITNSDFRFRAIVMRKKLIKSPELRKKKDSFYKYTLKMVLKHHGGTIKNAKIRIDGSGDRTFRRELTTYLKNNIPEKTVKNIRMVDSKQNKLIQLADMVAGSINKKYNSNRSDSDIYWNIIKKRKDDLWEFK